MCMRPRVFLFFLLPLLGLTGCTLSPTAPSTPASGTALQGRVHGGQQPISGAHVYLLAAGTGGYGGNGIAAAAANASTSLLKSVPGSTTLDNSGGATNGFYYVTTDAAGSFSITSDYSCTTGQQLYLYALGGNPGAGTNTASGLLVALGDCSTVPSIPYIWINEVSTIATAYALAPFASDALHISSSGTTLAAQGVKNAFLTVTNLETLGTGTALLTTPTNQGANGNVPQQEINTLANVLAICVNSSGPTSSACSALFSAATSTGAPGGIVATDTATTAIYIAQNPSANNSTLFNLVISQTAFVPSLAYRPNDWTMMLSFSGGGLVNSQAVAVDGSGNVWLTNYTNGGSGSVYTHTLSEFGPLGTPLSGATGYAESTFSGAYADALAIDASGNAWALNPIAGVRELNASGSPVATNGFTGGGWFYPNPTDYPFATLAFDKSGNLWGEGFEGVAEFNASGTAIAPAAGYSGGGYAYDAASGNIVIDGSGNVWAGVSGAGNIGLLSKFNSSGSPLSGSGYTGGGISRNPGGLAVDNTGNIWVVAGNGTGESLAEFNAAGTALSGSSGYTLTGLSITRGGIAADGSGHIWITGTASSDAVAELSSSGVIYVPGPANAGGYTGGNLHFPNSIAVDGSGNLWVANPNATSGNYYLTEIIGAATPVVTPIVANLISPYSAPASKP